MLKGSCGSQHKWNWNMLAQKENEMGHVLDSQQFHSAYSKWLLIGRLGLSRDRNRFAPQPLGMRVRQSGLWPRIGWGWFVHKYDEWSVPWCARLSSYSNRWLAWNLQPASGEDNGTYLINGAAPGRCLTVWAEDFIPAAWIVNQDCEFNRSNRASQLWELVEVCKLENSNAYNQTCPPTCKRSEYIQDNQCVPCPPGQFAEDNECRSCLPDQFWNIFDEVWLLPWWKGGRRWHGEL